MATFTNQTKNTAIYTNESKTLTIGLWNALVFPWQELLPWQYAGESYPIFTNQTKN